MKSSWIKIYYCLIQFWSFLDRSRKFQFTGLVALSIFTSFLEVISIGSIIPLLTLLTNPSKLSYLPFIGGFLANIAGHDVLVKVIGVFSVAVICSGLARLLLIWATQKVAFGCGLDLSSQIYRLTIYQPYLIQISRNSAKIVDAITNKTNIVVHNLFMPASNFLSALIMLSSIMLALICIRPALTLSLFFLFSAIYLIVVSSKKNKLLENSKQVSNTTPEIVRLIQESLGGIRDILIDHTQEVYRQKFDELDKKVKLAQGSNYFIGNGPRYAIESLTMLLLAMYIYYSQLDNKDLNSIVTLLGVIAFTAQRMMPVMQQGYVSWVFMTSSLDSANEILLLLNQQITVSDDATKPIEIAFESSMEFKNINFRYNINSDWVLQNLSLKILKGERIGIVGPSGVGKSTLVDLVLGLLYPESGALLLDGIALSGSALERAWQKRLAHVPQFIFLSDATVAENIAFGVPQHLINLDLVVESAKKASIHGAIADLPRGYQTIIGERGVKLSGGQRQRLGIARALYKMPTVLILDEATSSLDVKTEESIVEVIAELDRSMTIIVIAHRFSSLKFCEKVYEIRGKSLFDVTLTFNK